jgi:hypothetical protein
MHDETMTPDDRRTLEFLQAMADGEEEMPMDLRLRLEAQIRTTYQRRAEPGWRGAAVVSLAAAFVILVTSPGEVNPAMVAVVAVSVVLYGIGVRALMGRAGEPTG